ncbi:tetratricopeptide repeat protein [Fulvivirga lutimaris]|uniref:tetratricopeptide repeat protein n=1 Tax=Fulvivirga lutimaris TaxID=1819566 RepID=UPI0012BC5829|nr:tetratricopeptide repeat protein [Fulvivirga lutimaris]MTI38848.1 tetratricopeptide repeat protein [Fulvivirga lutimaris]
MRYLLGVLISAVLLSCTNPKKEIADDNVADTESISNVVFSLDGTELPKTVYSEKQHARLDSNLAAAKDDFEKEQTEMNYIWLGRRTAYMSRYNEAIAIFSEGINEYPNSYKLYRHRGHRYISTRKFDEAIADFVKAAELMPKDTFEIEPDGIPNKLNQPLSSTQFNVWYHLALAYYLKGDYGSAVEAYQKCMETSVNDDLLVATSDWLYMTLIRMGKEKEAAALLTNITEELKIIENDSYLKRLLMYKGELTPDDVLDVEGSTDYDLAIATQGYGVGNYYLAKGDTVKAKEIFSDVLAGKHWSAFGYIAAEADMMKMK